MERMGFDPQSHILSRQRNTTLEKGSLISNIRKSDGEVLSRSKRVLTTEENGECGASGLLLPVVTCHYPLPGLLPALSRTCSESNVSQHEQICSPSQQSAVKNSGFGRQGLTVFLLCFRFFQPPLSE